MVNTIQNILGHYPMSVRSPLTEYPYLKLLVQDIKANQLTAPNINDLPQGLSGYYYSFFNRIFGNNFLFYQEKVAPLLQIYLASESTLTVQELKYLASPSSESEYYRILSSLEHLFVFNKGITDSSTIAFFHNSVENWLKDYSSSGAYFISKEDGKAIIFNQFRAWLNSSNSNMDSFWRYYRYTIKLFLKVIDESELSELKINRERIKTILQILYRNVEFGGNTKYHEICPANLILDFFHKTNEEKIYAILAIFEETIRDNMISIGLVSPKTRMYDIDETIPFNGSAIWNSISSTAVYGYIARAIAEDDFSYSRDLLEEIKKILSIFAFYDRRVYDILPDPVPGSIWDYGDFTAIELDGVVGRGAYKGVMNLIDDKINKLYPSIKKLFNKRYQNLNFQEIKRTLFPDLFCQK